MIHEAVTSVADAIRAHVRDALATIPGGSPLSGLTVVVSRNVIDEKALADAPVEVRVEQQDAVVDVETLEAADELPTVQIGVTCSVWRSKVRALKDADDDEMCRVVRQVARAVGYAIRREFRMGFVERDGVQVRTPRSITYGEPEAGEDADLTLMTLSLSVPVLDHWAHSAGGV